MVRPLLSHSRVLPSPPPPSLRPRERFYACGDGDLSDAELVALVIGTGMRGKSALALGRELLDSAGGIAALARVLPQELTRHGGIGLAQASRLAAAFALGRRALTQDRLPGATMHTAADVYRHVWPRLAGLEQEVFLTVAVDARNVVIADLEIARGCLTGVEVHPREVFRPLIRIGATAAIAVHNHPSGDPTPSAEDVVLTERLRTVGALVGIPLVDHVVVAAGGHVSLAEWLAGGASG